MNKTRTSNIPALIHRAEKFRKANEYLEDQTRQRAFERKFVSRDMPNSSAAIADYSDGGRSVATTIRNIDAPARKAMRLNCIRRMAVRLPNSGILRSLLWAIYRNGSNRRETIGELGINERTYWRGLKSLWEWTMSNSHCGRGSPCVWR